MKVELIKKDDIEKYRSLILPVVFDELTEVFSYEESEEIEYLCLVCTDPEPVSVIITELEGFGDLNILSIYTRPEFRRKGYGTELLQSTVKVARQIFQWDDDETEDDIILKTLFRLPGEMEEDFAAFLAANGFTDFVLLEDAESPDTEPGEDGELLNVWSAYAQIHFYTEDTAVTDTADNADRSSDTDDTNNIDNMENTDSTGK